MLDQGPRPTEPTALQRTRGRALLTFRRDRLADLRQEGSAKLLFPRGTDRAEAVFLNTSGGLTGGDRLELELHLEASRLTATTQTAERAYLSHHGPAHVCVRAKVGAGSSLHWLPQETILFQGSDLRRDTTIDLAPDAELLLCESLTLGRLAMGETLTQAHLTDQRMVRRAGRPVWAEGLLLTPDLLARPALLCGARAFGVLALVAPGAEAVGALPPADGARVETSSWDGRTLIRIAADSGFALRRQMAALITHLSRRPLPRVWASGGMP